MVAKNRMSISLTDEEIIKLDIVANRFSKSRSEIVRIIIDDFFKSDSKRFDILIHGSGGPTTKRK